MVRRSALTLGIGLAAALGCSQDESRGGVRQEGTAAARGLEDALGLAGTGSLDFVVQHVDAGIPGGSRTRPRRLAWEEREAQADDGSSRPRGR